MNLKELFDAGNLSAALEAATQQVKAKPADTVARTFLFELLCFAGELDRAEKQLSVVGQLDSLSEWGVQVYENILHAERSRRRLFSDGLKPEFLLDEPGYIRLHLEAVNRLRENRLEQASELLEASEEARPQLDGRLGDDAFSEFRDCDDLFAPILELIIVRDYVWLPYEQIRELEVSVPERPRDLIWTPVRITLSDGSQRRGYAPALYPASYQHADDLVKLGRKTDWQSEAGGPVRGVGLRTFLAGDNAVNLLDLKQLALEVSR